MATPLKLEVLLDLNNASQARVINKLKRDLSGVGKNVKIKDIGSQLNSVARSGANAAKGINAISKSASGANRTLSRTDTLLGGLTKRIGSFLKFSIASFIVTQITQPLLDAAGAIVELDANLIKLRQVTGSSEGAISKLQSATLGLGKSLGVATSELSDAQVVLAQAGVPLRDLEKLTKSLAKTSLSASFDNVEKTAEALIAIRDQFKIGDSFTKDADKFLNVINEVSKNFAVESSNIAEAVRNTGSVFAQAEGLADSFGRGAEDAVKKFAEFTAVFSTVRATTRLSSSVISSGLRTVTQRLQRQKTESEIREVLPNVRLRDSSGDFIGVSESINEIATSIKAANLSSTSSEVAQIIEAIGGLRQSKITSALLFNNDLISEIEDVGLRGAAEDGLSKDAELAQNSLEVKLRKIGKEIFGVFVKIQQGETFNSLVDGVLSLTKAFTQLLNVLTNIAPLLGVLGGVGVLRFAGSKILGGAAGAAGATGSAGAARLTSFARGGSVGRATSGGFFARQSASRAASASAAPAGYAGSVAQKPLGRVKRRVKKFKIGSPAGGFVQPALSPRMRQAQLTKQGRESRQQNRKPVSRAPLTGSAAIRQSVNNNRRNQYFGNYARRDGLSPVADRPRATYQTSRPFVPMYGPTMASARKQDKQKARRAARRAANRTSQRAINRAAQPFLSNKKSDSQIKQQRAETKRRRQAEARNFRAQEQARKSAERQEKRRRAIQRRRVTAGIARRRFSQFSQSRGGRVGRVALLGAAATGALALASGGGGDVKSRIASGENVSQEEQNSARLSSALSGAASGAITGGLIGASFGGIGAPIGAVLGGIGGGILAYLGDAKDTVDAWAKNAAKKVKDLLDVTSEQDFLSDTPDTLLDRRAKIADELTKSKNLEVGKGKKLLEASTINKLVKETSEGLLQSNQALLQARSKSVSKAITELENEGVFEGLGIDPSKDAKGAVQAVRDRGLSKLYSPQDLDKVGTEIQNLEGAAKFANIPSEYESLFNDLTAQEVRRTNATDNGKFRAPTTRDINSAQVVAREEIIKRLKDQIKNSKSGNRSQNKAKQALKEIEGSIQDILVDPIQDFLAKAKDLNVLGGEGDALLQRAATIGEQDARFAQESFARFKGTQSPEFFETAESIRGKSFDELRGIASSSKGDNKLDQARQEVAFTEALARAAQGLKGLQGLENLSGEELLETLDKNFQFTGANGSTFENSNISGRLTSLLQAQLGTEQGRNEFINQIKDGTVGEAIKAQSEEAAKIIAGYNKILSDRLTVEKSFVDNLKTAAINVASAASDLAVGIGKANEEVRKASTLQEQTIQQRADAFTSGQDARSVGASTQLNSVGVDINGNQVNDPDELIARRRNLQGRRTALGLDSPEDGGAGRDEDILNQRAEIEAGIQLLDQQLAYLGDYSGRFNDALQISTAALNQLSEASQRFGSLIDELAGSESPGKIESEIIRGTELLKSLEKNKTSKFDFSSKENVAAINRVLPFISDPAQREKIFEEKSRDFADTSSGAKIIDALRTTQATKTSANAAGFGQFTRQEQRDAIAGGLKQQAEDFQKAATKNLEEQKRLQENLQKDSQEYIRTQLSIAEIYQSAGDSMTSASELFQKASKNLLETAQQGINVNVKVTGSDSVSNETLQDTMDSILLELQKSDKLNPKVETPAKKNKNNSFSKITR